GFTLFELVACLALVATIAGGAALRLPDILASVRLSGATQRLSAAPGQARGPALERGSPVEAELDDARGLWEVREVSGASLAREPLPAGGVFARPPARPRPRLRA